KFCISTDIYCYQQHPHPTRRSSDLGTGNEGPLAEWAATVGTDWLTYTRERPGMSAFALEDGIVHHTYSAYARGLDGLWGMYQWRSEEHTSELQSLAYLVCRLLLE